MLRLRLASNIPNVSFSQLAKTTLVDEIGIIDWNVEIW